MVGVYNSTVYVVRGHAVAQRIGGSLCAKSDEHDAEPLRNFKL